MTWNSCRRTWPRYSCVVDLNILLSIDRCYNYHVAFLLLLFFWGGGGWGAGRGGGGGYVVSISKQSVMNFRVLFLGFVCACVIVSVCVCIPCGRPTTNSNSPNRSHGLDYGTASSPNKELTSTLIFVQWLGMTHYNKNNDYSCWLHRLLSFLIFCLFVCKVAYLRVCNFFWIFFFFFFFCRCIYYKHTRWQWWLQQQLWRGWTGWAWHGARKAQCQDRTYVLEDTLLLGERAAKPFHSPPYTSFFFFPPHRSVLTLPGQSQLGDERADHDSPFPVCVFNTFLRGGGWGGGLSLLRVIDKERFKTSFVLLKSKVISFCPTPTPFFGG